jgi:hypothetical protein
MEQESGTDYKRLEVKRVDKADAEILSLLKETVLGSEGGMRYSMQNTEERIKAYGDGLSFMALYKKNSLKGVIGLCRRNTVNCGVPYSSTHLRYLSVQGAFQTEKAPARKSDRHSFVEESFKQKIFSMFRGSNHDGDETGEQTEPHVMYAYVESRNERSRNIINQAGYEYIRSFLTIAFSRFNPAPNASVTRLTAEEEPAMAELLAGQYRNYCFYSDEFAFADHRYYVLRKDNRIVAGVGAIPARYKVINVPGLWGWLMMKVFPVTPLFKRLFRPEEFRYVILNAIYCLDGNEDLLPDLFEAVCAEEGYNTALTWLDDHSELFDMLRTNRRMGALNRLLNAKPGLVYAYFSGLSQEETVKFYERPAYISGFDFS